MARTKEEIQEEYDRIYGENPNKWNAPQRIKFMIRETQKVMPAPTNILDYGCGLGFALEAYEKVNPMARLYGIEYSEVAMQLAHYKVPMGYFTTEDEFEDIKQFDLVLCMGVAEHVEDLDRFLPELKDRLTPGGMLYFEVPNNLVYSKGPHTYRRLKLGSKQVEWHFPRKHWETLLLSSGFEIVRRLKGEKVQWEFIWILS